jgi:hypothetical protein
VATVAISPQTATVPQGQQTQLTATVTDANGAVVTDRPVSWSSSNQQVATVSTTGVVTAVAPGSATILATSEGKSGTATIQVPTPPAPTVASVSVSPRDRTIKPNNAVVLTAECLDASGHAITGLQIGWTMTANKAGVASFIVVNATQIRVQGLNDGKATFTATCGGKSGSTTVTVD